MNRYQRKSWMSAWLYGTGIIKYGIRKWYNPLRWLFGKQYAKNIPLKKVFK